MDPSVTALMRLLDLEKIGDDIFRGRSPDDGTSRVFGGQVLAQGLIAGARTAPDGRLCHSLHAYFLKAGDPSVPITYAVDRSRDGGSFSVRRVVASQGAAQIFILAASFHKNEAGFVHQAAMPKVPSPETIDAPEEEDLARRLLWRARPFDFRPLEARGWGDRPARPALDHLWLRVKPPLQAEPVQHQALLAYASDLSLLDTALLPHGKGILSDVQVASLDHAMWFHRPFRADDWLLYSQDSPAAYGARGFARGQIFKEDGALVASVAQEGLIRPR
jgi:acyl-CoA thioesterase-2